WPRDWSSDVCSSDLLRDSATVSELYAAVGTMTQGPFWLMKFARTMLRIVRISTGETLLSTSMSRKEPLGIEPPNIWSMSLLPREIGRASCRERVEEG